MVYANDAYTPICYNKYLYTSAYALLQQIMDDGNRGTTDASTDQAHTSGSGPRTCKYIIDIQSIQKKMLQLSFFIVIRVYFSQI